MLFFLGQDRSYLSEISKPDGLLRIVCVGDSMTFGQGTLPTQTLPFQLEAVLNAALWDRQVEVINGGVCGYSIHDAWARYLDKFVPFRPDLVVVLICDNDAELYNHREAVEEHVRRQTYLEFSESCYDPAGEHFPYFRLLLGDMARHTATGGPPVVVAFYDIHGGDHRELILPRIREACQAAGVPLADLSQDFLGAAAATRNKHLKVSDADHHPSPLAHGIAARRLARCLIEARLLPRPAEPLPPEAQVADQCLARAQSMIRCGTPVDRAIYLLKRTLAAKRDSRCRLELSDQDLLTEPDYRATLAALDRTWRRFVDLAVWEAWFDGLKSEIDQFEFGLRLFDMAQWRLIKGLFVLEQRLADSALPIVGQFQLPRDQDTPLVAPTDAEIKAIDGRVSAWRNKLDRAREFAARSFAAQADASDLLPDAADMLIHRLRAMERQVMPLWRDAQCLMDAASARIRRFETLAELVRRRGQPEAPAALNRIWCQLQEVVGHLDFCLTAARLDSLNLLARSSQREFQTCLTTIQVQVTAPKCDRPFTSDEPLSLEIQVKPAGPFGRVTSDIHTIIRDGTMRLYQFALPFFVEAELRLGMENGQVLTLGTVRLSNAEDSPITLEPDEFRAENDGQVYRARVLVPA